MRYFLWMLVSADGKEETPLAVHRASEDWLTLERYDREAGEWVYNPGLLAASGIGGDHHYKEVSLKEAAAFLGSAKPLTADDADAPVTVYVGNLLGSLDLSALELGGPGSGNWAHAGRPGQIGGSQPRNSGMSIRSGKDWLERYRKAAGKEHPEAEKLREAFGKNAPKTGDGALGDTEAVDFDTYDGYDIKTKYNHWSSNPAARALYDTGLGTTVSELNMSNYDTRGQVKDEIVTELSKRTGIDYHNVNLVIAQWARSSNDHDYRSLCLQEDAAEEFGIKLSDWQRLKIDELKKKAAESDKHLVDSPYYQHVLEGKEPDPHGATRKLLRAMYELTQEQFKKAGITEVVIFRGIDKDAHLPTFEAGQKVHWRGNAIESWSASAQTAYGFGGSTGTVIATRVPVTRLLSTCRTGFGCLNELEYIVMASEKTDYSDTVTIVKRQNRYW